MKNPRDSLRAQDAVAVIGVSKQQRTTQGSFLTQVEFPHLFPPFIGLSIPLLNLAPGAEHTF